MAVPFLYYEKSQPDKTNKQIHNNNDNNDNNNNNKTLKIQNISASSMPPIIIGLYGELCSEVLHSRHPIVHTPAPALHHLHASF